MQYAAFLIRPWMRLKLTQEKCKEKMCQNQMRI